MPEIEVDLPDRITGEINRLVEQGEFLNREQAIEELVSRGVSVYDTGEESSTTEADRELFNQAIEDQQDPALQNEGDDERTF